MHNSRRPNDRTGEFDSTTKRDPLVNLRQYADVFEDAAKATDDVEAADAYEVLAALAQGRSPPRDVARRVVDRTNPEK